MPSIERMFGAPKDAVGTELFLGRACFFLADFRVTDSPPTGTGLAARMKNEDHLIDMRIDCLHRRVSGREAAVTLPCTMFGGTGSVE
jgi:hypothetical protein